VENALEDRAAVLHGLFDLRDGVSESEFRGAFEPFFNHLEDRGFAKRFRLMRHKPLPEFGERLPEFSYYIAIEFPNAEYAEACYEYVATKSEPVLSLHRSMNSKVRHGAQFFVSVDTKST